MKITKEEKSLYNFLNVFNSIFGKSDYRNTIVGRGNQCYFFANGYVGIFEDKDRDTMVGGNYDFKKCFYELKQTPSKSFVLDEIVIEDKLFDESIDQAIQLAENFKNCNNFKLEYEKDYEFKISKIANETGVWLKDTDIKYLNAFKKSEVFKLEDNIVIKSFGLTDEDCSNVTTVLVFVGEVHPNIDDSTQQKMDVDKTQCPLLERDKQMLIGSYDNDIMDDDPFPDETILDEDRNIEDDIPQAPFDDEVFF